MLREPVGRDRHADAGRDSLAERAGRRLDAGGQMVFRMTGALAVELPETLQIVERDRRGAEPLVFLVDRFDAGQMQHRIKQGRGVAADSTKRSRFGQIGSSGSKRRNSCHSV